MSIYGCTFFFKCQNIVKISIINFQIFKLSGGWSSSPKPKDIQLIIISINYIHIQKELGGMEDGNCQNQK